MSGGGEAKGGVLVVIAHPDDEVFASGAICLCARNGFPVEIVCATRGEGGDPRLVQPGGGPDLADIRRRELELSAAALGARAVSFLDQPDVADPDADGPGAWDLPSAVEALAATIERTAPALILTHGPLGGYGHPAHRLTHRCVMQAARAAAFSGSIFSFCGQVPGAFFSWHFDQPSDLLVDARAFAAERAASLSCHQSQISYFLQPYFPRTARKALSALFGIAFAWCEAGRKRVPIATPPRFFARLPVEGLVLQQAPADGRPHFFAEHFADDDRVRAAR